MTIAVDDVSAYIAFSSTGSEEGLYEEEDEDEIPAHSSAIQSGWAAALKGAASDKKYTQDFRWEETPQLLKFIDSAPFAVFEQHWLEGRPGKKSFVCAGVECPLCEIGDTPRAKSAFSVVNLSAEGGFAVEILLTSPTLTRQLAGFDQDPKTGPLDRLFWSVSRQGKGPKTVYSIFPVKARDLAEDHGFDQADVESRVDRFEPLTRKVIPATPIAEMAQIAREMSR